MHNFGCREEKWQEVGRSGFSFSCRGKRCSTMRGAVDFQFQLLTLTVTPDEINKKFVLSDGKLTSEKLLYLLLSVFDIKCEASVGGPFSRKMFVCTGIYLNFTIHSSPRLKQFSRERLSRKDRVNISKVFSTAFLQGSKSRIHLYGGIHLLIYH